MRHLNLFAIKVQLLHLVSNIMTGYELRLWRKGMGWDQERAAEELGKCLRTYKAYEKSPAIDRIVELATRSLTLSSLLPALSGKNSAEICGVLGTLVD